MRPDVARKSLDVLRLQAIGPQVTCFLSVVSVRALHPMQLDVAAVYRASMELAIEVRPSKNIHFLCDLLKQLNAARQRELYMGRTMQT